MNFKVVSADTMDPSGPFRTRFGIFDVKINTYARLITVGEKMHFLETRLAGVPHGVPKVKIVKNLPIKVQSPQKSIYSTPIHLKPILRSKL